MRPLRVGIVAESYYPTLGGIQEHVLHLRNLLCRRGVEVTILTGRPATTGAPGPEDAERGVVRVGRAHICTAPAEPSARRRFGPLTAFNFYRALRKGSSTSSTSTDRVTSAWRCWDFRCFADPRC